MLQVVDVVGGVGTVTALDAPFGLGFSAVCCGCAGSPRRRQREANAAKASVGSALRRREAGAACGFVAVVRGAVLRVVGAARAAHRKPVITAL